MKRLNVIDKPILSNLYTDRMSFVQPVRGSAISDARMGLLCRKFALHCTKMADLYSAKGGQGNLKTGTDYKITEIIKSLKPVTKPIPIAYIFRFIIN